MPLTDGQIPEAKVLATGIQSACLCVILPLTLPERRVAVAAGFLGVSCNILYEAAGISTRLRCYYRTTKFNHVPSWQMINLAKAMGVPFAVLWDEEALEDVRAMFLDVTPAGRPQRPLARLKAVGE